MDEQDALAALPLLDQLAVHEKKLTLEEALAKKALANRAWEIRKLSADQRPIVSMVWDLNPTQWHRAMDDHTAASLQKQFPALGGYWVELNELDQYLADISRRKDGPFSERYISRTTGIIAHLENGGILSPPLLVEGADGLAVVGGNHRLDMARHYGDDEVPILIEAKIRALYATRIGFSRPF